MTRHVESLAGFRVLIVEDEALIAMVLEDFLTDIGCDVVAVAGTVKRGLEIASDPSVALDGATLDVNLGGEAVYPIADKLRERGVPFVFASGYGERGLAPRFAGHTTIAKPFGFETLQSTLSQAWG